MNIFVLDNDPGLAAQMMCDKHVVKMVLETAQIISTVMQEKHPSDVWYRSTHKNHPCVKWASGSYSNFMWLVAHGWALADEYTYRYGKKHKSIRIFTEIRSSNIDVYKLFDAKTQTPFVLAMPNDCKSDDPVASYRLYYKKYKADIATWKKGRHEPDWWNQTI